MERATNTTRPTSVGLFAGIGGIELGLHAAGFETVLMPEIEPSAQAVLEERFPGVELHGDIRTLRELPRVELVAGGFPCQDLSQAGRTAGIGGTNSGLVGEVFRLLERERASQPRHRERRDPLLHGDSRTMLELRQPACLRVEHLVDHPPHLAQRAGVNG